MTARHCKQRAQRKRPWPRVEAQRLLRHDKSIGQQPCQHDGQFAPANRGQHRESYRELRAERQCPVGKQNAVVTGPEHMRLPDVVHVQKCRQARSNVRQDWMERIRTVQGETQRKRNHDPHPGEHGAAPKSPHEEADRRWQPSRQRCARHGEPGNGEEKIETCGAVPDRILNHAERRMPRKQV